MGRKNKLTDEDILFLRNNYGKISIDDISEKLKYSKSKIFQKAFYLGLSKKRPQSQYFSKEEDSFIIENYKKIPAKEIAKRLKRTPISIESRIKKLYIKRSLVKKREPITKFIGLGKTFYEKLIIEKISKH